MELCIRKVPLQGFGKLSAALRRLPGKAAQCPRRVCSEIYCNVKVYWQGLFGRLAIIRVIRVQGFTPLENRRLSNGVYTP
jgi:hypothetical protein